MSIVTDEGVFMSSCHCCQTFYSGDWDLYDFIVCRLVVEELLSVRLVFGSLLVCSRVDSALIDWKQLLRP